MEKIERVLTEYKKINLEQATSEINRILAENFEKNNTKEVYKTILSCIDLTSLNTNDTEEQIAQLTMKVNSLEDNFLEIPNVAAICVYPSMVKTVKDLLTEDVEVATVTGGFPHAQTFIEVKIAETALSILEGATEIDIVISVGKLLEKKYDEIIDELVEIKATCKDSKLKVILESGSLDIETVQIASILSLESGVDFIKTSTGKQQPGATHIGAYIMCQTIKEFYEKRGIKVGFKAAGGISSLKEALEYYCIAEAVLGADWLNKSLLRFGTSKLGNQILSELTGKEVRYF